MKERIQKLVDLGVTQTTIANGAGISKNMICRWLNGTRGLKEENEEKLRVWLEDFKKLVANI